jgi:hypothetical protein
VSHIRFNLTTAGPLELGDAIKFIEAGVRPRVESQPGNLGLALYADPELGVAVLESFWVSGDAMRVSEHVVSPIRREAARRASGTVSVERYQLPVFGRAAPLKLRVEAREIWRRFTGTTRGRCSVRMPMTWPSSVSRTRRREATAGAMAGNRGRSCRRLGVRRNPECSPRPAAAPQAAAG